MRRVRLCRPGVRTGMWSDRCGCCCPSATSCILRGSLVISIRDRRNMLNRGPHVTARVSGPSRLSTTHGSQPLRRDPRFPYARWTSQASVASTNRPAPRRRVLRGAQRSKPGPLQAAPKTQQVHLSRRRVPPHASASELASRLAGLESTSLGLSYLRRLAPVRCKYPDDTGAFEAFFRPSANPDPARIILLEPAGRHSSENFPENSW